MSDLLAKLVKAAHPVYTENVDRWTKNENVFRGRKVTEYLQKFDWEEADTTEAAKHYQVRKEMATFINFGARAADKMVGSLMREAPEFENGLVTGSLGNIRKKEELDGKLTRAEMLYYDCNRKGEGMHSFVGRAMRMAMGTGHRWLGVEQPGAKEDASIQDEQAGYRPYFTHVSPVAVPLWEFSGSKLILFMIKRPVLEMINAKGEFAGEKAKETFMVYVDGTYENAGDLKGFVHWVDEDGAYVEINGETVQPIPLVDGVIPYRALIYAEDEDDLSAPGADGLNNVSLSYMNLGSAGDNDAIKGGARSIYVLGGNVNSHNKAIEQKKAGGRFITIEATPAGDATMLVPQIYDMASVSASSAIEAAITRKRSEAEYIAADELRRGATTSGEARAIEYLDVKAPRLVIMASQAESIETFLLREAERQFGGTPSANVTWGRSFTIDTENEDWSDVADIVYKMEGQSATLVATAVTKLLRERELVMDEPTLTKIEGELTASIEAAQLQKERASTAGLIGALPVDGPDGPDDDE